MRTPPAFATIEPGQRPFEWRELRPQDKWFLRFIVKKDSMSVDELLAVTSKKHSEWSNPRARLIEKGIINCPSRGRISISLPRFREFVEAQED